MFMYILNCVISCIKALYTIQFCYQLINLGTQNLEKFYPYEFYQFLFKLLEGYLGNIMAQKRAKFLSVRALTGTLSFLQDTFLTTPQCCNLINEQNSQKLTAHINTFFKILF